MSAPAAGLPALRCTLGAPATAVVGQPVPLRLTLHNTGRQTVHVLTWGTPFEGWLSSFVTVQQGGQALVYGGASLKRGEPDADEYLAIAPGRSRQAVVDLAEVFDLGQPGHLHVLPRIVLHDWVIGAPAGAPLPRPRALHQGAALACNPVEVNLQPRKR